MEEKRIYKRKTTQEKFEDKRISMNKLMLKLEKDFLVDSTPTRFIPIGDTTQFISGRLLCVERPSYIKPIDCCSGCFFDKIRERGYSRCKKLQCSKFEREDRRFVWFVPESEEDEHLM